MTMVKRRKRHMPMMEKMALLKIEIVILIMMRRKSCKIKRTMLRKIRSGMMKKTLLVMMKTNRKGRDLKKMIILRRILIKRINLIWASMPKIYNQNFRKYLLTPPNKVRNRNVQLFARPKRPLAPSLLRLQKS